MSCRIKGLLLPGSDYTDATLPYIFVLEKNYAFFNAIWVSPFRQKLRKHE